jgi:hypothetical protein
MNSEIAPPFRVGEPSEPGEPEQHFAMRSPAHRRARQDGLGGVRPADGRPVGCRTAGLLDG